jgi:hypothetical protein
MMQLSGNGKPSVAESLYQAVVLVLRSTWTYMNVE